VSKTLPGYKSLSLAEISLTLLGGDSIEMEEDKAFVEGDNNEGMLDGEF
jgi:hypothetical protein